MIPRDSPMIVPHFGHRKIGKPFGVGLWSTLVHTGPHLLLALLDLKWRRMSAHSCSWSEGRVGVGVVEGWLPPARTEPHGAARDHPATQCITKGTLPSPRTDMREAGIEMLVFSGDPVSLKHFSVFAVTVFCHKEHLITYKAYF